ncbi:hypothetical protein DIR46_00585 [Massilia oculi]|uniref:Uncharacterized protein n=2 Tax=Massilia oculi TaxID=945844 RepID=A0A2S2DCM2_9BURK|nr:hypothetical protein DIR46_00585 [Massilia oculi]
MAEFVAGQIIERQQNIRQAQEHGLPAALQKMIDQVNAEATNYKGRDSDAKQLAAYLDGGNHGMAEFVAGQMIERQQKFRQAQEHGLPAELQKMIDQVNAEAINYKGRDSDAKQLAGYLDGGNHGMAEFVAGQMLERQQKFRQAQEHGLPAALQKMIDQVNAEATNYKGRDSDAKQLAGYLDGGNHGMAEFVAGQMLERQQKFRQAQEHGLPAELQKMIDQVNAEAINYKGRDSDAKQLAGYLDGGNHGMAEFVASQMIERQQNIRSQLESND